MKSLTTYINEKMVYTKSNASKYKYHPQTKQELKKLVIQLVEERGNEGDFNDIDTSKITDMSELFLPKFNGDISEWDVSKVTDMSGMFYICESFNQDISKWDVSNVKNMLAMFYACTSFNQDISNWDVSNVKNCKSAFDGCPIEFKYIPKFDI